MTPPIDPYCQGDFDGLCGLYAIVNALCVICPEINEEIALMLFRYLARYLNDSIRQPLPAVTYGIDGRALRRLVGVSQEFLRSRLDIEVTSHRLCTPRNAMTLADLWSRLTKELDGTQVAIIMTAGVHDHWTVGYKVTANTIRLVDSTGRQVLPRSRCTVNRSSTKFQLVRREILVLRKVSDW